MVYKLKDVKDIKNKICDVEGSWLRTLVIDGREYWNIDGQIPSRQRPLISNEVLPSDWRYREDLIWLKYNDELIAHQWKLRLELQ